MSDNKKTPQDDIIATPEEQPELLPEDTLDDAQGGFSLNLSRRNLLSTLGADTLYGGVVGDSIYGGVSSDSIYGGSPRDVLGGLSKNLKIYGG